ncbi:MAG: hypothetical protein WCS65_09175 [Verrucomicrobiae bacterium]
MMGSMGLGEAVDLRLLAPAWSTEEGNGWTAPAVVPAAGPLWLHGMPALDHEDLGSRAPGGVAWPLLVPANHHAQVWIVDVGFLTTAQPELHLDGGFGRRIQVTYAERLETCDGQAVPPVAPPAGWLEAARFNGWDEDLVPGGAAWSPVAGSARGEGCAIAAGFRRA